MTSGAGGATYLSRQYSSYFMEQIGLGLVIGLGLWVGVNVALIVTLRNDERPWRKELGEIWGEAFFYAALLQAIVFVGLIFMAMSVMTGSASLPDSSTLTLDMFVGAGYLSCFVFGATALYCATMSDTSAPRLLGGILSLITIGLALYMLLLHRGALETFQGNHQFAFVWLGIAYLGVFSAVIMHAYRLSLGGMKL